MKHYEQGWTRAEQAAYDDGYSAGSTGRSDPRTNGFDALFISTPIQHPWHDGFVDGVLAWIDTHPAAPTPSYLDWNESSRARVREDRRRRFVT